MSCNFLAPGLDQAVSEASRTRISEWVRNGGVLVTLDAATAWLPNEKHNVSHLRVRRDWKPRCRMATNRSPPVFDDMMRTLDSFANVGAARCIRRPSVGAA